jgi:hypothetical protein
VRCVANTAANRRATVRARARRSPPPCGRYALGCPHSSLTLSALACSAIGTTSLPVLLIVLTAANALATVARFLPLRHWVFAP